MSVLLTSPSNIPPPGPRRKRWTRDECRFLEDAGLLRGHYELLEGEIVDKKGQNAPHARAVMFLIAYLLQHFRKEQVRTQASVEVRVDDQPANLPEPDIAVLRDALAALERRVPLGDEVLLAVEVSDTTQADDLGVKTGLYARAGVAEYWVLDLPRRALVVFRNPQGDMWRERSEYGESDLIAPLAAPGAPIAVSDLLS